ncbi:MAG: metal-dependent hydrolase [Chitinophagales bacterium]|nr:metal-dependent hydrolase [Chitinophagales bacterium]
MNITYYGQSCVGIKIGNFNVLFDPFIKGNPLASSIDIKSIKADFILITHAHSDHMADAEEIAHNTNAPIITNNEMNKWFAKKGLKGGQGINYGGKLVLDFGTVHYVNAIHSSQFPDGSSGGNPGGFVIETKEGNFYHAGDTALTMDMKLIPMICKLQFAFLPIGGYYTMDYKDAVVACDFIECNKVIGMHYDSFPQIKIDHQDALNAFQSKGKELILMKIGETIEI